MGFGCARFATLTIAPPHPKGAKQQGKKAIYRKKFTPAIDYVTPQQAHDGLRPNLVEQRRVKKLAQRRRRREENQKQKTGPRKTNKTTTMPADLVA